MNNKTKRFCSYCGNPIDPQSKECPNCGQKYRKSKTGFVILSVIMVLAVLAVGAYFALKLIPTKQPAELSAEEIYRLASPATVEIRVETEFGTATGTGFFSGTDGTIITNFHVIEDATSGAVYLNNGEKYDIQKLVGFDSYLDIAIIQIDYQPITVLEMRTDLLQTGETVFALGSSLGLADSFSEGIISANQREIGGQIFIQTTAPISHGNSGGPLIDKYGKIVGITTAGIESGQNLNLAVPISAVNKIDCNQPVNFLGNLTSSEKLALKLSNFSYWEWAKTPLVICSTTDHQYHDGNCYWVSLLAYRIETNAATIQPYTLVYIKKLTEQSYEHCPTCNAHVNFWGRTNK